MKKLTVTIGICAYNEERNIAQLLTSIRTQKRDIYSIEKIIVVCDGCSDNTAAIVKEFAKKEPTIVVFDDGKRKGVSSRLEEIFTHVASDILVVLDADIVLSNPFVITALVKKFTNPKVGLVGGLNIAQIPKTFVEKIVVTYEKFWRQVVENINGGNTVHNCPGCIWAGKKEFVKKIHLSKEIIASDHYIFLTAIQLGYTFAFAKDAIVYFKVPNNLKDYLKQTTRFLSSKEDLSDYFGNWYTEYYSIPTSTKIRAYIYMFLHSPVYMTLAIFLQFYQRIYQLVTKKTDTQGIWGQIASSK